MTARLMMAAGALAMLVTAIPMQHAQAQSLEDRCEDYAYRAAYRERSGDKVVQGAVGGAVAGAALGAILGKGKGKNIGRGAVIGGVAGTALGATRSDRGYISRKAYRRAYRDCMAENRPIRVRQYDDDIEYCLSRYRSYNPDTGYYRTYSGQLRACP